MTITGSWLRIAVIVTFITYLGQVSGWSSINQSCTPFQAQYNSCDPYAYLFCDTSINNNYKCKCRSPDFVWSHIVGRCTQRVGSTCYPPGTGTGGSNSPGCPPSAYCGTSQDHHQYICRCNANFKPNSDGSACNGGVSLMKIEGVLPKGILLVIVTFFTKKLYY